MATPTSTQLQIASDSGFNNLVVDKSGAYTVNISVSESDFSGGVVPRGVSLYSRVKHSADTGDSAWSSVVNFTIAEPWSPSSIVIGTPVQCNSRYSNFITTVLLSTDKVLVCYSNATNGNLYSLVLTVSGTTITASAPVKCNSHRSDYISTTLLSTDKVLVCYRNDTNSYYLYSLILTGS